jgi:hypothetical protein
MAKNCGGGALPLVVQSFLKPATPAVPAATKKDHDDKDDDQKRCVVHFLLVWPNRSTYARLSPRGSKSKRRWGSLRNMSRNVGQWRPESDSRLAAPRRTTIVSGGCTIVPAGAAEPFSRPLSSRRSSSLFNFLFSLLRTTTRPPAFKVRQSARLGGVTNSCSCGPQCVSPTPSHHRRHGDLLTDFLQTEALSAAALA